MNVKVEFVVMVGHVLI